MATSEVEVRAERLANDLRISVKARQHALTSDAGVDEGGTDQGPTPHEIIAMSLAACTSMTVQMYASRKGWPLESADVTVHMGKNGDATLFNVMVSFRGTLAEEQRARLLEIAGRCPIHRALAGPIELKVTLV